VIGDVMADMLTTVDNPFSPLTEYDKWYAFDEAQGYHTPSLLARIALTSDALSDADQELAIDEAIATIISEIGSGFYVKVPIPD
jgi:hypothetical protein